MYVYIYIYSKKINSWAVPSQYVHVLKCRRVYVCWQFWSVEDHRPSITFLPVLFPQVYTWHEVHGWNQLVLCEPAVRFSRTGVLWLCPQWQTNTLSDAANIVCITFAWNSLAILRFLGRHSQKPDLIFNSWETIRVYADFHNQYVKVSQKENYPVNSNWCTGSR